MELLQILNEILVTKNKIRDILGENNDISRYSVSIHNLLASSYNESYRIGFNERYYTLTGESRWIDGPETILDYTVDARYYDKFTTEILTDIMRDVLNYKLQIKDEMNEYLTPEIGDVFSQYPPYLLSLIEDVVDIGYENGVEEADNAYEESSNVETPTISYSNNRFTLTSSQTNALIYFSLGVNGLPTLYTGQVTVSESVDVYYWAKIGKSISSKGSTSVSVSSGGYSAFVSAPIIYQEDNFVYITTSTSNSSIQYSIDGQSWCVYYGPILISESNSTITALCVRDNEYSKYNVFNISFTSVDDSLRPANVSCSFSAVSGGATVTLSCSTTGARILYAVDESDGFYREYSSPFTVNSNHFLIYTYSVKDNITSKLRLVYKYDVSDDITKPDNCKFIDDGSSLTVYTTTSDAVVYYRLGAVGAYTSTSTNSVTLRLTDIVDVYAYSYRNGITSQSVTKYTFYPTGSSSKPAPPTMLRDGNTITLVSSFDILYTTNQTDPRVYGIQYNKDRGIVISEYTVIKAVSVRNGVYSDVATSSFKYDDSSTGGESGSEGGGGDNGSSNGTDTNEEFVLGDWMSITGTTGFNFSGTVYFANSSNRVWKTVSGNTVTGLDPNIKTYLKGNVSSFISFNNPTTVAGDISSVKGGMYGVSDKIYSSLFKNCSNLVSVSDIRVNVSTMPDRMFESMFEGCTDLVEAAFDIDCEIVSEYGMSRMFYGCSSLIGGPNYSAVTEIERYGLGSAFQGCVKLSSIPSLNLSSVSDGALSSTYRDCREIVKVNLVTPTGVGAVNVFDSTFYGCNSLEDASGIVFNFTSLSESSCYRMFYRCSSLTKTFNLTPTILGPSCYSSMFEGCSSLVTAPILSATTLASNCCARMFYGCSSLRTSPDLNVTSLFSYGSCYREMFTLCSNLNHIKALFTTNPSSGEHTANWVSGVAENGTFEVNKEANWVNGSGARGVNAIPEGWTVVGVGVSGSITDIFSSDGYCYITASNSDDIWYTTGNSAATSTSQLTTKYTSPFKLSGTTIVSASTKNSDGVWGSIVSKEINPDYPNLVISKRSGKIVIGTGTDFVYDYIQYKVCEFESSTVVSDWSMYDKPFSIDTNRRIYAKGLVNGTVVTETYSDIVYNTTSPTIEFNMTWNGTHTAALSIWCIISYPNTDVLNSLWYKVNDNGDDNPDTEPSKWIRYTGQFDMVRNNYLDPTHPRATVTAIANVKDSGSNVWTSENKGVIDEGSTETLYEPVLIQVSDSNNVILEYNGLQYQTWDDTDVVIEYKYNLGGDIRVYRNMFNLSESGAYSESDISVYCRARISDISTDWKLYTLHYNPSYVHYDVETPTAYAVLENDNVVVYVNNNTQNAEYYNLQNYFKIEVVQYDASGLTPSGGPYGQYYSYTQPFILDRHIVKFKIWAQSRLKDDWSEEYESKVYDIKSDFGIVWDERPVPLITINPSTLEVTITCNWDVVPMIKVSDTVWGSGAVDEHKYDNYSYATSVGFGKMSSGVYVGTLDSHLASGTIYAKYTYDGLPSSESSQYYENSSVQVLVAPTVETVWDRERNSYILYVTNEVNDGVVLKFRMSNCVWSGGVVDEHKYDAATVVGYYGTTISEYLISADIYGQTVYENEIKESAAYKFTNTHYTSLQSPKIYIVSKNGTNSVKVTNSNKLATNYFRVASPVWSSALDPNKYNKWTTCFITGNDLDSNLLSGTIEAYSVWGSENTLDDIVSVEYDTGITINDTAPSISVVPSTNFYNVTITNLSDRANYPFIKYKVDDIEWNGDDDVFCSASNYSKDTGDGFLVSSASSVTFTIGTDVLSGTILSVCTDSSSVVPSKYAIYTKMTSYSFVNGLVD